ncbi:MAG: zinc ribbon domain-containing protein [Deltaproteobacteria bacterium]|nr:zinc ribbon domain-containing protein [Deltaproteobacteria bacterium]
MSLICEECGAPIPSDKCPACHQDAPQWAKFCPHCGQKLINNPVRVKDKARYKRQLCSDESCIGIIGPNGVCTDCGKRP